MLGPMRGAVPDRDGWQPAETPDADPARAEVGRWRVARAVPTLKILGAVALGALTWLFAVDISGTVVGAAAAMALLTWAARDLVVPVRLAADASGVTVPHGLTGRRTIPWDRIERIRVDVRSRIGLRSETLEIDTGGALYLFGASDLGAEPADVAVLLRRIQASAP